MKLMGKTLKVALVAGLCVAANAAYAGSLSKSTVLNGLKMEKRTMSKTRSFGKPSSKQRLSSKERRLINKLSTTRAIKVEERDKVIEIAVKKELPAINVKILFDFNSAQIKSDSFDDLEVIAEALNDKALEDAKIMLNGHTDAKGSDSYNQDLSVRRALSVKHYLVGELNVDSDRLITAGFGENRLKNPDEPFAAENRRVEIINLGS